MKLPPNVGEIVVTSPTFDNTCIIIVAYHPDDRIVQLLNTSTLIAKHVCVVVNDQETLALVDHESINWIFNKTNIGLSKALNQGVDYAYKCSAEWCLFFDQDSLPEKEILLVLEKEWSGYTQKNEVGVVGVNYRSKSGQKIAYNLQN